MYFLIHLNFLLKNDFECQHLRYEDICRPLKGCSSNGPDCKTSLELEHVNIFTFSFHYSRISFEWLCLNACRCTNIMCSPLYITLEANWILKKMNETMEEMWKCYHIYPGLLSTWSVSELFVRVTFYMYMKTWLMRHSDGVCSHGNVAQQRSMAWLHSRMTARSRSWPWVTPPQRRARRSPSWAALSHRVNRICVSPCSKKVLSAAQDRFCCCNCNNTNHETLVTPTTFWSNAMVCVSRLMKNTDSW